MEEVRLYVETSPSVIRTGGLMLGRVFICLDGSGDSASNGLPTDHESNTVSTGMKSWEQ